MVWKQHNHDNDNRNNKNSKRDSVDGSEIPNNHRLDGAKTLKNSGDKLLFPQLVSLPTFIHQQFHDMVT